MSQALGLVKVILEPLAEQYHHGEGFDVKVDFDKNKVLINFSNRGKLELTCESPYTLHWSDEEHLRSFIRYLREKYKINIEYSAVCDNGLEKISINSIQPATI